MGGPAGGHHHPGPGTEPSGDRPGLGRCGYAPALEVTDGSIFVCTYVRTVADVDSWADMPETSYPEQSERHARFWFSYTRIFVPENEAARSCQKMCIRDRSETCRELKGAVINAAQAAVVARILGIRVEP